MEILICMYILCASSTPCQSYELIAGNAGWALQFDGIDDFSMLFGEMSVPQGTVEMWIKPMSLRDGQDQEVVKYNRKGVVLSRTDAIEGRNIFNMNYNGQEVWRSQSNLGVSDPELTNGNLVHYAYVYLRAYNCEANH